MVNAPVTKGYLRRRGLLAHGLILLSALAAFAVFAAVRAETVRRAEIAAALDDAQLATAELVFTFDGLAEGPGPQRLETLRADLRRLARNLADARDALAREDAAETLGPETLALLRAPTLDVLGSLDDLLLFAERIGAAGAAAPWRAKVAETGGQLAARLLPALKRMKETERASGAAALEGLRRMGWLALAATAVAVAAAEFLIRRPMERRVLSAQAEIIEGRRAAEAASEAKTVFLATMSHEIRTPLNGVLGMAELLGRTALVPEQRRMLDIVRSSGAALLAVIGDVLDLAKIEAGRFEPSPAPADLAELCRSVADLFSGAAIGKGLVLAFEAGTPGPAWGVTDAGAVRQMVSNLVGNAVKFTERGRIDVTLRLSGAAGDRRAAIEVRDQGVGVAPEAQARIFGRFEQADGSVTRRFGGAGLGLAITRGLAEALGGGVSVVSAPGAGAAFTLDLPFPPADPPDAAAASEAAATAAGPPVRRVLVAEDNAVNRMVIQAMLAQEGCAVTLASDGAEAVEAARRTAPELILMDVSMPVMDGLAATRAIRAEERGTGRPPARIVGLSAHALDAQREAARAAGMDGYLTKPIDVEALRRTLRTAAPPPAKEKTRCA